MFLEFLVELQRNADPYLRLVPIRVRNVVQYSIKVGNYDFNCLWLVYVNVVGLNV